jgi:N-acyl-L-homoserine lactone synthetase
MNMRVFGPTPEEVTLQQFADFMALRKQVFVDELNWDLTHTSNAEWDEYDLPSALFIVVYEGSKCIGGARLIPTDNVTPSRQGPPYTYMLNDFVTGRIKTAMTKEHMLETPPKNRSTWELTRFVSAHPDAPKLILKRVNDYLRTHGGKTVLTLSPPSMMRMLKALGYSSTCISKKIEFDGKRYIAISTSVK